MPSKHRSKKTATQKPLTPVEQKTRQAEWVSLGEHAGRLLGKEFTRAPAESRKTIEKVTRFVLAEMTAFNRKHP